MIFKAVLNNAQWTVTTGITDGHLRSVNKMLVIWLTDEPPKASWRHLGDESNSRNHWASNIFDPPGMKNTLPAVQLESFAFNMVTGTPALVHMHCPLWHHTELTSEKSSSQCPENKDYKICSPPFLSLQLRKARYGHYKTLCGSLLNITRCLVSGRGTSFFNVYFIKCKRKTSKESLRVMLCIRIHNRR